MAYWICVTCGTQYAESINPPAECPICQDNRQYVGYQGQKWTTLADMQKDGYHNTIKEYEPRLTGIGTTPSFAIGQRALLVQTDSGNVLWDCISLLDDDTAQVIEQRGGISAIAISHPHFFTTMVEWAKRFKAPIHLHEEHRQWVDVTRPDKRINFWSGDTHPLIDGITLVRLGGHFPGSTVLHWRQGTDGKGTLLTGDTIQVVADRRWVSFMFSYPNLIPLSASKVGDIRNRIRPYDFERLYGGWFDSIVSEDAKNAVVRSADRYIYALESFFP